MEDVGEINFFFFFQNLNSYMYTQLFHSVKKRIETYSKNILTWLLMVY